MDFDPVNYQGGETAIEVGHGFLFDASSSATQQGQLQTACFLSTGKFPIHLKKLILQPVPIN